MNKINLDGTNLQNATTGFIAPASFALWAGQPVLEDSEAGPTVIVGNADAEKAEECAESHLKCLPFGGSNAKAMGRVDRVTRSEDKSDLRFYRLMEVAGQLATTPTSQQFETLVWGRLPSPFSPVTNFAVVAKAMLEGLAWHSKQQDLRLIGLHRFRTSETEEQIMVSAAGKEGGASALITLSGEESGISMRTEFDLITQIEWHIAHLPETWDRRGIEGMMDCVLSGQIKTDNLF